MSRFISRFCSDCKKYGQIEYAAEKELFCPNCRQKWGEVANTGDIFDQCPVCGCRQFYLSKNFNQFLGCFIMGIGIILVPFTYGLSLPAFALLDWALFRRVPYVINCYRCGCEFCGFGETHRFKPFLHHIGLKYDKYR